MLENEFHIARLIATQMQGGLTPDQQAALDTWIGASEKNRLHYEQLMDDDAMVARLQQYQAVNSTYIFNKITIEIAALHESSVSHTVPSQQNQRNIPKKAKAGLGKGLFLRIMAAAAVVLLLVVGGFFLYQWQQNQGTDMLTSTDVSPGGYAATLTLADGQQIHLSSVADGKIVEEAGVAISKTGDGQLIYEIKEVAGGTGGMNTLTTAKGETYQVLLPDGSRVWLNAASQLTYPVHFTTSERQVAVTGEAFFDVAQDPNKPFVITVGALTTTVLGTTFNVKAYEEEAIAITVATGKVKVEHFEKTSPQPSSRSLGIRGSVTLQPNEQAMLDNATNELTKRQADPAIAMAWKNKLFLFESENIQAIMRMLARWYDVEVVYETKPTTETFSGGVSRFDNLSKVLQSLEATGKVRFRIEGSTLYVMN